MPSSGDQISDQLVLKEDYIFVTTDEMGDMPQGGSLGLYYNDTRYLSVYRLTLEGKEPVLLSASSEQSFIANLQLANPPLGLEDGKVIRPYTVSLRRNRLMREGMRERIGLFNYNPVPVRLRLQIDMGADFRDMFDVRGFPRAGRGTIHDPLWDGSLLTLAYTGLDSQIRCTRISFDPAPTRLWFSRPSGPSVTRRLDAMLPGEGAIMKETVEPPLAHAVWEVDLQPDQPWFVNITVVPEGPPAHQPAFVFDEDARLLRTDYAGWREGATRFTTGDDVFNAVLERAIGDLRLLVDPVPGGLLPAAGIPWYSVPFGRDAIITGLQTLLFRPEIAAGTLRYLAQHQGMSVDPWRDEEPGKILHEMRAGEMARLNEIPHSPYYGSIDATPLFVILFTEIMRWTCDTALMDELLPAVMRALEWIDTYGDLDGDGFVEFETKSRWGLRNQGWKDSYDSILFADGKLPEPPIALVEVQAYVYAAKKGMADLLARRGDQKEAARLAREAHILKERFNQDFWMPEEGCYAQALDGQKRKVPSISSNAGHALFGGIAMRGNARRLISRLMKPDMLCGWGIRTLSEREPHFNPMSYHNGSIWPHDNALIAAGMARYGFRKEAAEVMRQVMAAGVRFHLFRMPELYCGFARDLRYYSVPAEYPVSCSPQAWAAGAILHFCQTMLGIVPDAAGRTVRVHPHLLPLMPTAHVEQLRIGDGRVSFSVEKQGGRTRVHIIDNPSGIEVLA